MAWIASQPWSSGIVKTIGASADGICSFVELMDEPEWLKAQFIVSAGGAGHRWSLPHVCR